MSQDKSETPTPQATATETYPRRETPEEKRKRETEFWKKLVWELTSCDEATSVMPDMYWCPVCGEKLKRVEGTYDTYVLVHKDPELLYN